MSYEKKFWSNGDTVGANDVNKWENTLSSLDSSANLLLGTNNNQIVTTYESGRLKKVEEKNGSTILSSSTLTYDPNGNLSSVTDVVNGITTVSTLNYENGVLTSVTRTTS